MELTQENMRSFPCQWCLQIVGAAERVCPKAPPGHRTHGIIGGRDMELYDLGYARGLKEGLL